MTKRTPGSGWSVVELASLGVLLLDVLLPGVRSGLNSGAGSISFTPRGSLSSFTTAQSSANSVAMIRTQRATWPNLLFYVAAAAIPSGFSSTFLIPTNATWLLQGQPSPQDVPNDGSGCGKRSFTQSA